MFLTGVVFALVEIGLWVNNCVGGLGFPLFGLGEMVGWDRWGIVVVNRQWKTLAPFSFH